MSTYLVLTYVYGQFDIPGPRGYITTSAEEAWTAIANLG